MSTLGLKQAFIDGAHDTLRAARRDWQEVKKGAIEAAYGVGDAVQGAIAFPEVALQYITGTSGRLGQLNPWSRFGSRYEDNEVDSPTLRTIEVVNHMVYGSLDLLSGHLLYSGAKALGVEHYTPFFSPAPTTIRGFASDFANVAFMAVMPEAGRVVKAKLGLPAKVAPVSKGSVFQELAESAERAQYLSEMAQGQARLKAMKAEMAAAAQDGVAFNRWATNGERGAIILSKPKPIKWDVLARTCTPEAFLDAVKERFAYFKAEVIRHIDAGRSAPQILEWYNGKVMPELKVLLDAIKQVMNTSEEAGRLLHNFRNRIMNLYGLLPLVLAEGSLVEVRMLCSPPKSSLSSIFSALAIKYEAVAWLDTKGLTGVRVAPHVSIDAVMQVLENWVQNAVEHRRDSQPLAQLKAHFTGRVLAMVDKGKGMSPTQVERVNAGIRSHNGEAVGVVSLETQGHGFGIQTVHKLAAEMGAQVVYASTEGERTTAALIAQEPGFFVPDAMTYIFTDEGNWGHLEAMVKDLSTEQRLRLVGELSTMSVDIIDTFYTKYIDLAMTHQDRTPAIEIAHRLLKRYAPYLEALVGDDPIVRDASVTQTCTKIMNAMSGLVNPPQ